MTEAYPTKNVLLPTPPAVVAVEGNYTAWTLLWKAVWSPGEWFDRHIIAAYPAIDRVFIDNTNFNRLTVRVLSTGVFVSVLNTIEASYQAVKMKMQSCLGKYYANVVNLGGFPNLRIYKDGVLQQTIDLSLAPILWVNLLADYIVSMTPDGKYVFVESLSTGDCALWVGA